MAEEMTQTFIIRCDTKGCVSAENGRTQLGVARAAQDAGWRWVEMGSGIRRAGAWSCPSCEAREEEQRLAAREAAAKKRIEY